MRRQALKRWLEVLSDMYLQGWLSKNELLYISRVAVGNSEDGKISFFPR